MNENYSEIDSCKAPQTPSARSTPLHDAQRHQSSQVWKSRVALATGAITALFVFQSVTSQAAPLQGSDITRAILAVGLGGALAGVFSCIAIHLIKALAGSDLSEFLAGDVPVSRRWLYLASLGLLIGAGVATFRGLAAGLLPLLPSHLIL